MDQQVIRRKLAVPPQVVVSGGAARAWGLALARAARDSLALVLDVASVWSGQVPLAELLERAPERPLILLLAGPGGGNGVLMLCPEVLAALIEVQTLGHVTTLPVPPRRPTRTDAALVVDWADHALAGLEEALQADDDLVWTDGFRQADFLEEPRPLSLMLEDAPWQLLRADCDLAGARRGQILLALPVAGRGRQPQRPVAALAPMAEDTAGFTAALTAQVREAEAQLRAVLSRQTLPLGELMSLAPGQTLALPNAALDRIDLCGADGRLCGQGKLGQQRGMRAVRITQCGSASGGDGRGASTAPVEAAPVETTALARAG